MRTLLLLRHAKSNWDATGLDDHERSLNKRGVRDAPVMGAYIAKHDLKPDLVLCSDAVRARATLTLLLPTLGAPSPPVRYEPRLYLAEPPAIVEVLHRVDQDVGRCLVVGHNPGMHALALGLVGDGDRKDISALAMKFPTSGLAVIEFAGMAWSGLKPGTGRLRTFVSPKLL
jgi:phosphohistidine phosphatase